jgi:Metallo-beta-lactamase superfamily
VHPTTVVRFLGTRGEIDVRSRCHRRHSSLLIQRNAARVMIDCGADWLDLLDAVSPTAIVLTHAHPDHAAGLARGASCPVFATKETWNLIHPPSRRGSAHSAIEQIRPDRGSTGQGSSGRAFDPSAGRGLPPVDKRWKLLLCAGCGWIAPCLRRSASDRYLYRRRRDPQPRDGAQERQDADWPRFYRRPACLVREGRSAAPSSLIADPRSCAATQANWRLRSDDLVASMALRRALPATATGCSLSTAAGHDGHEGMLEPTEHAKPLPNKTDAGRCRGLSCDDPAIAHSGGRPPD